MSLIYPPRWWRGKTRLTCIATTAALNLIAVILCLHNHHWIIATLNIFLLFFNIISLLAYAYASSGGSR